MVRSSLLGRISFKVCPVSKPKSFLFHHPAQKEEIFVQISFPNSISYDPISSRGAAVESAVFIPLVFVVAHFLHPQ